MIIQSNVPALNAGRNLKANKVRAVKNTARLASGYRINSSRDDAAGLAVSEGMRAQIRGLKQAEKNTQDGISLIQIADGALEEVNSMLIRMRELSVQSANGTYTDSDRAAIDLEIQNLKTEIDRVSTSTEFNDMVLLDGTFSTELHTVMLPDDVTYVGSDFASAGIQSASFPAVTNPAVNDLYKVPQNSGSDDIYFYPTETSGIYRVEYVNAGMKYEGTLNKSAVGSGAQITLTQTTGITTNPANSVSLDIDATINSKILSSYLDAGYDYINVPVRTHAVTANLAPGYNPGNPPSLARNSYYIYPNDLGIENSTSELILNGSNRNENMGITEFYRSGNFTVEASDLDEHIKFVDTGIGGLQRHGTEWSISSKSGNTTYTNKYKIDDRYTQRFYISKVGGTLQYQAEFVANYSQTVTPPGATNNYGLYSLSLTGTLDENTDTVSFNDHNGNPLYSFKLSDAGKANLSVVLPDDADFAIGAYCFSGTSPNNTGAFTNLDSHTANYYQSTSSIGEIDPTIVFNGGGTINYTLADDGTINASLELTVLDDAASNTSKTDTFQAIVTGNEVELKNSGGQYVKATIDLDKLKKILAWGDKPSNVDDSETKYSEYLSPQLNSVTVSRRNNGEFLFKLSKPNGDVIMEGKCAADASTVTLEDTAYGNKGDTLTFNFKNTGYDTLANLLREESPGDSYRFDLSINPIDETPGLYYGGYRYPADYDIDYAKDSNPFGNLSLTCGTGTTDFGSPNPPAVTVRNSGSGFSVTIDTGEAGTYTWSGSGSALPNELTASYNGKTIKLSGADALNSYLSFSGDTLSGTLEWTDIQQPYIEVNDRITARHYPKEAEVPMGEALWIQTGANRGQGIDVIIRSARVTDLGGPDPYAVSEISASTTDLANEAIGVIDSAISDTSMIRAELGAYQNRLEYALNNIGVASENLIAAESNIRDADMALEIMEHTKNNILEQASTALLAQVNQAPQRVLQLLTN